MLCAAVETVRTRETVVAAAKLASPAWLASMMQVPAATSVSVLPLTVQVLGVVEAKDTGRPDVAVATSEGGGEPSVWLPGPAKLMDCGSSGAAATERTRDTVGAAA